MHPNFFAAREHARDLRAAASKARIAAVGQTPVTRVTLRRGVAADRERLEILAELDSAEPPAGAVLIAEVDGRLRAALPLDGGPALADPFHHGADLLELLRLRAAQLSGLA